MWLAERAAGVGAEWGTGVLKADSQADCGLEQFFRHICMNGHRQIRACVPFIVWMKASSFSELLEISCLAVGGWRAELLTLLQGCSRVAVGGVEFSCKSLLRHWIAPLLPWCRDYVPVPPLAELMGLCTSWSSGCQALLLYWWEESCWKYFSGAQKRNGPLCCFMSFKTVAFHF